MTRREFDALTRQNWGGRYMASDERANYRETRHRPHPDRDPDPLARRAAYAARTGLRPLQLGSALRAPYIHQWRARADARRARAVVLELRIIPERLAKHLGLAASVAGGWIATSHAARDVIAFVCGHGCMLAALPSDWPRRGRAVTKSEIGEIERQLANLGADADRRRLAAVSSRPEVPASV